VLDWGARVWQAFAVVASAQDGRRDGRRTQVTRSAIAIRAVESQDGMTADWARLDPSFLARPLEPHHERDARRQPRGLRHHGPSRPRPSSGNNIVTVRTRYAPSPTGALHIGNVRSGLFCLPVRPPQSRRLYLRIDDTDTERSTTESLEEILESLRWLGRRLGRRAARSQVLPVEPLSIATARARSSCCMKSRPIHVTARAAELDAMRKRAERETSQARLRRPLPRFAPAPPTC